MSSTSVLVKFLKPVVALESIVKRFLDSGYLYKLIESGIKHDKRKNCKFSNYLLQHTSCNSASDGIAVYRHEIARVMDIESDCRAQHGRRCYHARRRRVHEREDVPVPKEAHQ